MVVLVPDAKNLFVTAQLSVRTATNAGQRAAQTRLDFFAGFDFP
jgi:hypothetical protein